MNSLLLKNPYLKYMFYILGGIAVFLPIIWSLFRAGIDCDSAYFICISERITEGYVPYETIRIGYTPLWMYIMAAFKMLFHIPNGLYWPYLVFFYIFEIVGAYFLYKIIRRIGSSQEVAVFGAGLYLLIAHWLWGNCVLLEIPFLFWGLLSIWLALEWQDRKYWWYVFVGVLSAFAFLSKQFGLGFLVLDMYVILFMTKGGWKNIGCYLLGYMIPIILCHSIWGMEFWNATIFNGYGTTSAAAAGYDVSIMHKLDKIYSGTLFFLKFSCPALIFSVFFLYEAYKHHRLQNFIFAYCGIFGFALQFFYAEGYHYTIPLVPFGVILLTEIMTLETQKGLTWLKYFLVIITVCITLYKTYHNRVYKQYWKTDEIAGQISLSDKVKPFIADDETLFIVHGGIFHIYFCADILPPNISTIGYSFGPMGLNSKTCQEQIKSADWVLRLSADYPYESEFTDSLKHVVETYPVIWQSPDSGVLLHKMKRKMTIDAVSCSSVE